MSFDDDIKICLRNINDKNRYDLYNLYVKLEKLASKYHLTLSNPLVAKIPLENETSVKMTFYKSGTKVSNIHNDGSETVILTREASVRREKAMFIHYEAFMKDNNIGIGHPPTKEMLYAFRDIRKGDVLSLGNGKSFVCMNDTKDGVILRPLYHGSLSKVKEEFSKDTADIKIEPGQKGIFDFYHRFLEPGTFSISGKKVSLDHDITGKMNAIIMGLKDGGINKLTAGPWSFYAKYATDKKGVIWYDDDMKRIPEIDVRLKIAWLSAAPVRMDIIHKESSDEKAVQDDDFKLRLMGLFSEQKLNDAETLLEQYVIANKGELAINMSSFDNDKDFSAVSFVFRFENGKCGIYEVHYEDNDFAKDAISIEKVTASRYLEFCMKKYTNDYKFLVNRIETEYAMHMNFSKMTEKQLEAAENMVKRKAKETPAFNIKEEDIDSVRDDVSALIEEMEM